MRRLPRTLTLVAAAAALGLAACTAPADDAGGHEGHGDTEQTSAAEADGANDVDIMFAQMMIPHHEQAIEMSELVLANPDTSPEVSALAQQIKDAQDPEIVTMTQWLEDWGAEPMTDHDGHEMDGMLTEDEIADLAAATGPDVDRLFLTGMIAHHEGAITMAETEVADGADPDAIALAEEIIATQQAEIDEMQGMLDAA